MQPPIKSPTPPLGDPPAVFPRSTAEEVLKATRYVRAMYRNSTPGRRRRRDDDGAGAYAYLASGSVVTAASGSTLGSGSVSLCSRVGAVLTSVGPTVTVYNAGGQVTGAYGTGTFLKLGWADGAWALDVVPCS